MSRAWFNPIKPKTTLILPGRLNSLSVSTEPTHFVSHDEQLVKGTMLVILHNSDKSFFLVLLGEFSGLQYVKTIFCMTSAKIVHS